VIDAVSVGSGGSSVAVTLHGGVAVTGVPTPDVVTPRVQLAQNYPNPFNPSTTIRFTLPQRDHVRLTVHDVRGRLVRVLENEDLPAGEHRIAWGGVDKGGRPVASGVYFYRLVTKSGATQSKRMIILK